MVSRWSKSGARSLTKCKLRVDSQQFKANTLFGQTPGLVNSHMPEPLGLGDDSILNNGQSTLNGFAPLPVSLRAAAFSAASIHIMTFNDSRTFNPGPGVQDRLLYMTEIARYFGSQLSSVRQGTEFPEYPELIAHFVINPRKSRYRSLRPQVASMTIHRLPTGLHTDIVDKRELDARGNRAGRPTLITHTLSHRGYLNSRCVYTLNKIGTRLRE